MTARATYANPTIFSSTDSWMPPAHTRPFRPGRGARMPPPARCPDLRPRVSHRPRRPAPRCRQIHRCLLVVPAYSRWSLSVVLVHGLSSWSMSATTSLPFSVRHSHPPSSSCRSVVLSAESIVSRAHKTPSTPGLTGVGYSRLQRMSPRSSMTKRARLPDSSRSRYTP
jgi:hypothetical protein